MLNFRAVIPFPIYRCKSPSFPVHTIKLTRVCWFAQWSVFLCHSESINTILYMALEMSKQMLTLFLCNWLADGILQCGCWGQNQAAEEGFAITGKNEGGQWHAIEKLSASLSAGLSFGLETYLPKDRLLPGQLLRTVVRWRAWHETCCGFCGCSWIESKVWEGLQPSPWQLPHQCSDSWWIFWHTCQRYVPISCRKNALGSQFRSTYREGISSGLQRPSGRFFYWHPNGSVPVLKLVLPVWRIATTL